MIFLHWCGEQREVREWPGEVFKRVRPYSGAHCGDFCLSDHGSRCHLFVDLFRGCARRVHP